MDSESPIKAWVRRHSPLKGRSKPIPETAAPPPAEPSPTRQRAPGRVISGNTNASSTSLSQKTQSERPKKQPKNRISSFLKSSKGTDSTNTDHAQAANNTLQHPASPPDSGVTKLTQRVSSLEAQLELARAELAQRSHAKSPLSRAHGRRAHSLQLRTLREHHDIPTETDAEVEARQARLQQDGRYTGLVESLLEPDWASATAAALQYSSRRRGDERASQRSVTDSSRLRDATAISDWRRLEAAYMSDQEAEAARIARQRSELREQQWRRMQEHMARDQHANVATGSKRGRSTSGQVLMDERPTRRVKSIHGEKALPALPSLREATEKAYLNKGQGTLGPSATKSRAEMNTTRHNLRASSVPLLPELPTEPLSLSTNRPQPWNQRFASDGPVAAPEDYPPPPPQQRVSQVPRRRGEIPSGAVIRGGRADRDRDLAAAIASDVDFKGQSPHKASGASNRSTSSQSAKSVTAFTSGIRAVSDHANDDRASRNTTQSKVETNESSVKSNWEVFTRDGFEGNGAGDDDGTQNDYDDDSADTGNPADNANGAEVGPPSPAWHRLVPSPARLQRVEEEFEWNDEEIF